MTNENHCECTSAYESLFEFLDGECDEAKRAHLQAHIDACPGCFEKLGIEKQVRALLQTSCATPAPGYLMSRIKVEIAIKHHISWEKQ